MLTSSKPKSAELDPEAAGDALNDEAVSRRHVFGRTKGKALKPRQAKLMETLFPKVSISLDEGMLDPRTLFKADISEIWLEVGFGGGEHLAWQAAQNPHVGFIGAEPFINGVAKLVSVIDTRQLANIRIHADDARFLLEQLAPGSLARIFILYPDPWHKLRHNKRRFVNDETLVQIERVLCSGGELRFASDIPHYVNWTLKYIARHNETGVSGRFEEIGGDRSIRPDDWPRTRYEAKAIREGRTPAYLRFRRM